LAAALVIGVSGPAAAQANSGQKSAEVSEVVVTGSYIAGTPQDAALPVGVIGADELKKQGSPTTVNLIKNITAAQSSIGESNHFLGTAAGTATVNLRSFGSSRTLVLFNGHRMAVSPTAIAGEATDVNFIPQAAIGRIEILRDGAAATYGSDAVGGVVNFITRKDLDGFELNGNYTAIGGSDGDYARASCSAPSTRIRSGGRTSTPTSATVRTTRAGPCTTSRGRRTSSPASRT